MVLKHYEKFGNLYGIKKTSDGFAQEYSFIYKGKEYDATEYVKEHPGGREFFDKFRLYYSKDITDYFNSSHSEEAKKILKNLPLVNKEEGWISLEQKKSQTQNYPQNINQMEKQEGEDEGEDDDDDEDEEEDGEVEQQKTEGKQQQLKQSEKYQLSSFLILKEKVKFLEKNNIYNEILLSALNLYWFLIGSAQQNIFFGIIFLTLCQISTIWVFHYQLHSKNKLIYVMGKFQASLLSGISPIWFMRIHNLHHCFTGHFELDEQLDVVNRIPKQYLPFLMFKWRLASLVNDSKDWLFTGLLLIHYFIVFRQSIIVFFISQILAGIYVGLVLQGSQISILKKKSSDLSQMKEDETKQEKQDLLENLSGKMEINFMEHQISINRNYLLQDILSQFFLGGCQFKTEHHLFPQIPLYHLPLAHKIIDEYLKDNTDFKIQYMNLM